MHGILCLLTVLGVLAVDSPYRLSAPATVPWPQQRSTPKIRALIANVALAKTVEPARRKITT